MKKARVSVIQMDIKLGELRSNLDKALKLTEKALNKDSDLIILPEMWPTGFDYQALESYEPSYYKDILSLIANLADKGKAYIVAGSMAEIEDGNFYNTSFAVDPFGKILGGYRKVHLFKELKEDKFFTPGDKAFAVDTKVGKLGIAVCYDLRFPEIFRTEALAGAEIICVPAEFPKPRLEHWLTLLQARAIENQCFIVGANRVGKTGKIEYFGNSVIFGPYGECLGEAGKKEEVLTADIDLDTVSETRERLPSLRERRPEAYRSIGEIEIKPLKIEPPKEEEKEEDEAKVEVKEKGEREETPKPSKKTKEEPAKKKPEPEKIEKKSLPKNFEAEQPVEELEEVKVKHKKKSHSSEDLLKTKLSLKEAGQPMKSRQ